MKHHFPKGKPVAISPLIVSAKTKGKLHKAMIKRWGENGDLRHRKSKRRKIKCQLKK
jgi:ribosomal protein L3